MIMRIALLAIFACLGSSPTFAQVLENEYKITDAQKKDIIVTPGDFFVIGCKDAISWCYDELEMPPSLMDEDGGTIRLIMQNETSAVDEVRTIAISVGCEFNNGFFGHTSKYGGTHCWFQPNAGAPLQGVLGDGVAHTYANPYSWVIITDFKYLEDNSLLGGNRIRIYSHPSITTRVRIID